MKCNSLSVSAVLADTYSANAQYRFELQAGLAEVNALQWNAQLAVESTLQTEHVAYFAAAGFVPHFIRVLVEGDCIMQILCYDSPLHIENVEQNLENRSWLVRRAYKTGLKLLGENRRMLICGHPHLIGDLGFVCHVGLSAQDQANILRLGIMQLMRQKGVTKLGVIKEFTDRNWQQVELPCFKDFTADDNYVLPIDPTWKTIGDYTAVLTSKYRTKRKSDLKKSGAFVVEDWSAEQIEINADRITELYKAVLSNANFYLGKIEASHLAAMKRDNPEQFSLRVLVDENGKVAAFFTAWISDKQLDAFLIGMDYSIASKAGLYATILHNYVEQAIATEAQQLVFGRTGGLAKSSVGAFPQTARCFITHRSAFFRALLNVVFTYVKPTSYPFRNPWKKEYIDSLNASGRFEELAIDPAL